MVLHKTKNSRRLPKRVEEGKILFSVGIYLNDEDLIIRRHILNLMPVRNYFLWIKYFCRIAEALEKLKEMQRRWFVELAIIL